MISEQSQLTITYLKKNLIEKVETDVFRSDNYRRICNNLLTENFFARIASCTQSSR